VTEISNQFSFTEFNNIAAQVTDWSRFTMIRLQLNHSVTK